MATSATGTGLNLLERPSGCRVKFRCDLNSDRASASGFTLLELLVVMFIVGIVAAMATLSLGVATRDRSVDAEAERIEDLLRLASEEAVLQAREFGLTFSEQGYTFSHYDAAAARWQSLGDRDGPFAARKFVTGTLVDLGIDGRLIALDTPQPEPAVSIKKTDPGEESSAKSANRKNAEPHVLILSSGEITPFQLYLRPDIGQPGVTISVAADGRVERVPDEQ